MGVFNLFKKDSKLKNDLYLSEYFDPYYHSGDMYIASRHCVQKEVVIPGGPQGYITIKIPTKIKTKEKLYEFLIQEHKFHKKENAKIPQNATIIPKQEQQAVDNSITAKSIKATYTLTTSETKHELKERDVQDNFVALFMMEKDSARFATLEVGIWRSSNSPVILLNQIWNKDFSSRYYLVKSLTYEETRTLAKECAGNPSNISHIFTEIDEYNWKELFKNALKSFDEKYKNLDPNLWFYFLSGQDGILDMHK